MEVGTTFAFAGWGGTDSDEEVWRTELAMADLAEPLGFESIWSIEHHFSNYTMVPEALKSGRCELRSESYVRKIETDDFQVSSSQPISRHRSAMSTSLVNRWW